jgi:hypothetical protein
MSPLTRPLIELVAIHLLLMAYLAFLWLPIAILVYAVARRQTGLRFLFVVIAVEAVAIAVALYLRPWVIS